MSLNFALKSTLNLLRQEYPHFIHVAELYVHGVHFLLLRWYNNALIALLLAAKYEKHKVEYRNSKYEMKRNELIYF